MKKRGWAAIAAVLGIAGACGSSPVATGSAAGASSLSGTGGAAQSSSAASGSAPSSSGTGGAVQSSSAASGGAGGSSSSASAGGGASSSSSVASSSSGGPVGAFAWGFAYPFADGAIIHDLAVDPAGNAVIVGEYTGSISFDGGVHVLSNAGFADGFVAKIDPAGNVLWAKGYGGTNNDAVWSVAVDAQSDIVITGTFTDFIDFGGGAITIPHHLFVAKLDPNGGHLWSKGYVQTGSAVLPRVALDASANVFVAGDFNGSIDFGGGAMAAVGLRDLFLAKLTAGGAFAWSHAFGDVGVSGTPALDLATDAAGAVYLTGHFGVAGGGSIDFGGGSLATFGGEDVFLAKLDASGTYVFAKSFGDTGPQVGDAIAVDANGDVTIAGYFSSTIDFGSGVRTSTGMFDANVFVAKFTSAGAPIADKEYGPAGSNGAPAAAVADAQGDVAFVGGYSGGPIDFGGGPLPGWLGGIGQLDGFVFELSSGSTHVWSRRIGSDNYGQAPSAIGAAPDGSIVIAGNFQGKMDLGGGLLMAPPPENLPFVARYAP